MYKILKAEKLNEIVYLMVVEAPMVAKHCQPGQFIIVKLDDAGERVPLTICDYDREAGTVTIVFQPIGASTEKFAKLQTGDAFEDFVGPLGCPSEFVNEDIEELKKEKIVFQPIGASTEKFAKLQTGDAFEDFVGPLGCPSEFVNEDIEELKKEKILFVAGGVGTAPVYPQVKWLHEHGIDADVIVGAKTKDLVILEKEMEAVAGNLYVTTDDGSYGRSGMVTKVIDDLVAEGKTYTRCVAIGPMIMMKFCCLTTKKYDIPTIVSMNPIMVDGTGMCGACRVICWRRS